MAQQHEPPAAAASGEIHGKISIAATTSGQSGHMHDPLLERYGAHRAMQKDTLNVSAGRVESRLSDKTVVYLESRELNEKHYPVPGKRPILDQRDLQFHPQVLPILLGTTVDFPNRDNLFHNVFSYSKTKPFDLGRYPKDDSRSVTFDKPGIVRVYCDIHSHMNATILVLENPYFAAPDGNGTFAIQGVPEGTYTIVLWYDRDVVERRVVQVRSGQSTEINFAH
jgi:plastocyanin